MNWHDGTYETTVTFPTLPFSKDPAQINDFMRRMTKKVERQTKQNDQPIYTCKGRNLNPVDPSFYGEFMPVYLGALTPELSFTYTASDCFTSMDFSFAATSETTYEVTMTLGKKSSLLCHEYILFGDTESVHVQVFYESGTHVLKFNMPTFDEQRDLSFTGLRVFKTCEGLPETLESALRTIYLLE